MTIPTYLVMWPDDNAPLPSHHDIEQLATTAPRAHGDLLALGPVEDVVENAARPAPPWASLCRFDDADSARRWYENHAAAVAPGTAVLLSGSEAPVWWPEELRGERPLWSQRAEIPPDRLGVFVSVWIDIHDLKSQLDYREHFRWTVERHDGAVIAIGPVADVVAGDRPPSAMALMTWPSRVETLAWYNAADYLPYRAQRHAASDCTVISVRRHGDVVIPAPQ